MPGVLSLFGARRRISALAIIALISAVMAYQYYYLPRLNVILVTFDTTRADHLGIYGYSHGLTTDFDDFARGGVVFDRAYAPAPVTLPSHATMLTGLYPPEHGLRVNGTGRLARNIPALPEILKERGYDTGAFVAAFVLNSKFGLERGFDTYDDDLSQTKATILFNERRRDGQQVVDSALSWIRQRTSRPFFCWIHLYDAHGLYDARPDQFGQKFEQNPYDAGIAVESQQLGRLAAFLKDRKLDENTLVVVAGDHGEGLDDHTEFEHGMLVYNTTLHVPLVFSCPRECQPGLRVSNSVSLVDLTPTILDILQIPAPQHVSGRSLRASLKGAALSSRECYAEAESPFEFNRWCPLHAVISDRWKYIQTTQPELYDLEQDPGENTNLAESANEECQRMRNILEVMQEAFVPATAQNLKLTEKDQANLAALGYVTGGKSANKDQASKAEVLPDIKEMLPVLAKFERARHLCLEGKYNESIDLLEEIVRVENIFPAAFNILGDCLIEVGRMDEAVTAFRTVLEKRPDLLNLRLSLGKILVSQGHTDQAAAEFQEIIRQDPENAPPHFELAQLLLKSGKIDAAIVELREAIRIAPEFAAANVHLGLVFAMLQRFKDAKSCFEQAVKYEPDNALAHASLSTAHVQLGEFAQAIEHGRKSVELDPKSFEAHFNLGLLFTSQNRHEEGISQLTEAQKLRPDDPRPLQLIQQAKAALKRAGK